MTIPTSAAHTMPGSLVAAVGADGKPAAPVPAGSTAAAAGSNPAITTAAKNFESYFLSQSIESMFAGVDTNSLFGGGPGEKIYRSMLLQEYGKITAQSGGFGIADSVQRALLQQQEVKQ